MSKIEPFERVLDGLQLSSKEWERLAGDVLSGKMSDYQIAALLGSLRTRGLEPSTLQAFVETILRHTTPSQDVTLSVADCCGTGGDGAGLINVSTATAFVAATLGVVVGKHGSTGVSSRCGSSDVLRALGVTTAHTISDAQQRLQRHQLAFLHAPDFHPILASVAPIRRALRVKTIFNAIGPLVNPLRPVYQLVGVYRSELIKPVAEVLQAQGVQRALVVHGAGLDELNPVTANEACLVIDGKLEMCTIRPKDVGCRVSSLESLSGADANTNAQILTSILQGKGTAAQKAMVGLNAGALLWVAGRSNNLKEGIRAAMDVLETDMAFQKLSRIQEDCQKEAVQ